MVSQIRQWVMPHLWIKESKMFHIQVMYRYTYNTLTDNVCINNAFKFANSVPDSLCNWGWSWKRGYNRVKVTCHVMQCCMDGQFMVCRRINWHTVKLSCERINYKSIFLSKAETCKFKQRETTGINVLFSTQCWPGIVAQYFAIWYSKMNIVMVAVGVMQGWTLAIWFLWRTIECWKNWQITIL